MKKTSLLITLCTICFCIAFTSCNQQQKKNTSAKENITEPPAQSKKAADTSFIGAIETEAYVMKLHDVFSYEPKMGDEVLSNIHPKEGYRFIYLDVSLLNKGAGVVDGGSLFISLKVEDEKGVIYKKPSMALAVYCSENPGAQDKEEYDSLWETFTPGEFHRAIVYAVEVPVGVKNFTLSLPVDKLKKDWQKTNFSI